MLKMIAAALVAALLVSAAESAFAQQPTSSDSEVGSSESPSAYTAYPPPRQIPSLSYNYYYPSYGSGQYPARMYLCPVPVPEHVGYTWITYQALAPHEFMHPHRARYGTYHPGSGWTITSIRWW